MRITFFIFALIGGSVFAFSDNFLYYEAVAIGLLIYFFLDFIYSLGKKFRIVDTTILFSIFQCLLMPMIIYHVYNEDKKVIAFEYNMALDKEQYFSFMLYAVLALIAGIRYPINSRLDSFEKYESLMERIRVYLSDKENIGVILIGVGFGFGVVENFLPDSLAYFAFLFSKLIFVGILYVYYSQSKAKKWYLIGGIALALIQALIVGIFGDLVYLTGLSTILILLGREINFSKSLTITITGIFFILLIQTIKGDYRKQTWVDDQSVSKASSFFNLVTERLTNADELITKDGLFPMVVRFNQGMIVDKVMNYVPAKTPYAEGKTIYLSLAASFVPRFLWPDKPEAGGHANMLLFTGFDIQGYSMNVGPYGEGYANFGKTGAIIYMFFYGLFFNYVFSVILAKAQKHPTILLWVPYLFLNSIQVETDTLLTVNTIIKGTLFIWFCFWLFRRTMGVSL